MDIRTQVEAIINEQARDYVALSAFMMTQGGRHYAMFQEPLDGMELLANPKLGKPIAGQPHNLPSMRDPDNLVYYREEVGGLIAGGYERQPAPWFLDGTASSNPDEGQSEPGMPPDTITEYAWELSGDNSFNDALGAQPDVTAFFQALGVGNYLVQLRVTDNTAAAYPSSGMPNLTDTDSAQVNVKDAGDPACSCVSDLTANVVLNGASFNGRLRWTWRSGAIQYNVYRGTAAGGPYAKIATVSTQVVSGSGIYFDTSAPGGAKYFWVVREAALNGDELCQSNEASATLRGR